MEFAPDFPFSTVPYLHRSSASASTSTSTSTSTHQVLWDKLVPGIGQYSWSWYWEVSAGTASTAFCTHKLKKIIFKMSWQKCERFNGLKKIHQLSIKMWIGICGV